MDRPTVFQDYIPAGWRARDWTLDVLKKALPATVTGVKKTPRKGLCLSGCVSCVFSASAVSPNNSSCCPPIAAYLALTCCSGPRNAILLLPQLADDERH